MAGIALESADSDAGLGAGSLGDFEKLRTWKTGGHRKCEVWPPVGWMEGCSQLEDRLSDIPFPQGGTQELVSMEEQDARVPALEPFRVEQVDRSGV